MIKAVIQALGKRVFYTARKSAALRRVVAMPVFAGIVNRAAWWILRPTPEYPRWIKQRVSQRLFEYACDGEPGLLSFLTTVWNTNLDLLKPAVESLLSRQTVTGFQWVVLDNGSTLPEVVTYLKHVVSADPRVVFLRVEKNLGIIGGMQLVMSKATGRYVLPFDSDDLLQPDAVAVLTHQLKALNYPPLLYTDEDKLDGDEPCWPYFKPDWDPVLFLNSCYVAHLGCMDRVTAIQLGVYTDSGCDGCHDWDAFMRFTQAGHVPVHIGEMLYSWRMHRNSTAANARSKNYIFDSQRKVLMKWLANSPIGEKFELQLSPLFQGTPDWWFKRKEVDVMPILSVVLKDEEPGEPRENPALRSTSEPASFDSLLNFKDGLVLIHRDSVKLDRSDWRFEVTGLFERYPDAVMIGGLVLNSNHRVVESIRVPGFSGGFGCPDRGRVGADPGAGAALWKQRSVSGVSDGDPDRSVDAGEMDRFKRVAGDFMLDRRYYSQHFSLHAGKPYAPVFFAGVPAGPSSSL